LKKQKKNFKNLYYISIFKKRKFFKSFFLLKKKKNRLSQSLYFANKILVNIRRTKHVNRLKVIYKNFYNNFFGDFSIMYQKTFLYKSDFRNFFLKLVKLLLKKKSFFYKKKNGYNYLIKKNIFFFKSFAFKKIFFKFMPSVKNRFIYRNTLLFNMPFFLKTNSLFFYYNFFFFKSRQLFFYYNLYRRFNFWFYFYKYKNDPHDFFFFLRKLKSFRKRKYKKNKYFNRMFIENMGHY